MRHYWAWVKGQWIAIVATVVVFNALFLGYVYVDGNAQDQKRQDEAIAESKRQTQKITDALNKHTELLNSNDQQLREYGEATLCVLAILRPDAVPSADPEKCRAKLSGINNADGTFLSGSWPPLPPEPGSHPVKEDTQQQTGFLQSVQDSLSNLVKDVGDL